MSTIDHLAVHHFTTCSYLFPLFFFFRFETIRLTLEALHLRKGLGHPTEAFGTGGKDTHTAFIVPLQFLFPSWPGR